MAAADADSQTRYLFRTRRYSTVQTWYRRASGPARLSPMAQTLTGAQIESWDRDGFLIVRGALTAAQADQARLLTMADPLLAARAHSNANYDDEQHGGGRALPLKTMLSHAEFSPVDEVCSAWCASARLVAPLEQLFRDNVCHYYSILMRKDPQTGGWIYHQDYGYHHVQFLRPEGYASAMLALAPATVANGCLRVYRGSHKLGRLPHTTVGAQQIADPERVDRAACVLEEVACELDPGDVLYFHGNTLHASSPNLSSSSRWSIVYSYAAAGNPVIVAPDPTTALPAGGLDDMAVGEAVARHVGRLRAGGLVGATKL